MIYAGSRYEKSVVARVLLSNGRVEQALFTSRVLGRKTVVYNQRTMAAGERLDAWAERLYGDPKLWWVIAKANPDLFYPDNAPMGTVLRFPDATALL